MSFAPLPLQTNMLAQSSTNRPLRRKENGSVKSHVSSSSSSNGSRSSGRRTRHRPGGSSTSAITGNPVLRAAQHAAMRAHRRSQSPPIRDVVDPGRTHLTQPSAPRDQGQRTVSYRFPTVLPRPKTMPEVSSESLVALDSRLEGVPLSALKDHLMSRRDIMLRGIACVDTKNATLPPTGVPSSIRLDVDQTFELADAQYPTHFLCVVDEKTRKGQLYPIHSAVLVAHLANFPRVPPPAALRPDASRAIDFPTISINLPHSASFSILFDYMYTKHFSRCIAALVPLTSAVLLGAEHSSSDDKMEKIVSTLSDTQSGGALLERLQFIHGMWSNVVTLGFSEEGIWRVMNIAWTVLLKALQRQEAQRKQRSSNAQEPQQDASVAE